MKVLIVDDSLSNRDYLRECLNLCYPNAFIYDAIDGNDALRWLSSVNDIDIVLLDVMMPNMNGMTCLKAINMIENRPIVIMVTCCQDKFLDAYAVGADGYLTKPISIERLKEEIEKHYDKHS